ncbi:uncharacterized protein LOC115739548 [Rhodamnia argentea]|uniref:Uncharacterized protein LOC115739548 n=1 Tax=Rhodamnia argentea TaxID=178133 RepID=A0A8B8P1X1_9MYRT|nr:uncharacterized protein LOC115739548 [Rhodamnia argentea]
MALTFPNLSWWLPSRKHKEPRISNGSPVNSVSDAGMESDNLKFPLAKSRAVSSSRNVKRKWRSREERKIDREYDIVLVPPDGGCISGSESDDREWSIGWLEPHGPGFQSDDDSDDSFAVLVPCYGKVHDYLIEDSDSKIVGAVAHIAEIYPAESGKYMEQWLCTLQSS